ncbi:MAG: hypothetical protein JWM68_4664 [Verrucomicrobiales bacterium]|nr:hypothetical protein [Verrucomicrobiales bacterium]
MDKVLRRHRPSHNVFDLNSYKQKALSDDRAFCVRAEILQRTLHAWLGAFALFAFLTFFVVLLVMLAVFLMLFMLLVPLELLG